MNSSKKWLLVSSEGGEHQAGQRLILVKHGTPCRTMSITNITKEKTMKINRCAIYSLIGLIVITASCASINSAKHNYIMSGQVLEATDNEVYLCIGHSGGAAVGQEYTVKKFVKTINPGARKNQPLYKQEETGTVKITEIVDEHYAKAVITAGVAKANYFVDLKQ